MTADHLVSFLHLQPHPEGGYFKESYRSAGTIEAKCLGNNFTGDRNYSTAIYFLLRQGDFSAFHRIKSDECWHFYEGGTLLIHVLYEQGLYECIRLGSKIHDGEIYQHVVPAGAWFASEPAPDSNYSLVGCTVAPGFDFADFEMAGSSALAGAYPQHRDLIRRLCR